MVALILMEKEQNLLDTELIWKDIEVNRQKLFEYPNIKFVAQSVISNLNLWSLPDFHYDWFSKGFLGKHNVALLCS